MKRNYLKPETKIIEIESIKKIMATSETSSEKPCDCYQHQMYGGCEGCPGEGRIGHTCTCECNHWDDESQEIIPG
jgi:hypothetical protein